MTAKKEISKALDRAFLAALLLSGNTEVAENAVLDGIAALDSGYIVDDILLVETIKSAIHRRADHPGQSEQSLSQLPFELRRLFLLAPISRDCFVLRVLVGLAPAMCSLVLRLAKREIEGVMCAAMQDLPLLGLGLDLADRLCLSRTLVFSRSSTV
jgi:hypothetical protein